MGENFDELPVAKTFLQFDQDGKPATERLRLATAVLLWQMAYVDGRIEQAEAEQMIHALNEEFHLVDAHSGGLLEESKAFRQDSEAMETIFQELKIHFSDAQRKHLFDLVLNVAQSDGKVVAFEKVFAAYLRYKLNLAEEYGADVTG